MQLFRAVPQASSTITAFHQEIPIKKNLKTFTFLIALLAVVACCYAAPISERTIVEELLKDLLDDAQIER